MYRIRFAPECQTEFEELRNYITSRRSRRIANAYLKRLRSFCLDLRIAPHRGERRPDLKEQQRTIGFEGRISVVFRVYQEEQLVIITGIRYAGRQLNQSE